MDRQSTGLTILPLTYLGSTEYFTRLLTEDCIIDLGENYVKQTHRNRCEILTANGQASLTVNVVKGGSKTKKAVKDMRIDYSKAWQHQHSMALRSSYKNSPFFDHYWEHFAPFYEKRYDFLADFNIELLETTMKLLGRTMPEISENYISANNGDNDLRGGFPSKSGELQYQAETYWQVFSDRLPFTPNLSVIDLLFCEGPEAPSALR